MSRRPNHLRRTRAGSSSDVVKHTNKIGNEQKKGRVAHQLKIEAGVSVLAYIDALSFWHAKKLRDDMLATQVKS